jgi:hypothetical protein
MAGYIPSWSLATLFLYIVLLPQISKQTSSSPTRLLLIKLNDFTHSTSVHSHMTITWMSCVQILLMAWMSQWCVTYLQVAYLMTLSVIKTTEPCMFGLLWIMNRKGCVRGMIMVYLKYYHHICLDCEQCSILVPTSAETSISNIQVRSTAVS